MKYQYFGSFLLPVALLAAPLLSTGCKREPLTEEALAEVLLLAQEEASRHDVSEVIVKLAAGAPWFALYNTCGGGEGYVDSDMGFLVELGPTGVAIAHDGQQEWQIQAYCDEHPDFQFYQGSVTLSLTRNNSTGSGTMRGNLQVSKSHNCEFDLSLTFDPATGQVLTFEGDICGDVPDPANFVVPFIIDRVD